MKRIAGDSEVCDLELVRRAQSGDSAAFAGLVVRYQDRVYNTCYRMCHNHADALDLAQTTFVKALEGLARFETRANFYTWLFRIAVNATISHRRARQRRPTVSLDPADPDGSGPQIASPDGRDAAARRADTRELHERLTAALDRLADEFRAAVVLKDVEQMDYATIAEILEVPVGTVKSRIHRGRAMLRELLTAEEPE